MPPKGKKGEGPPKKVILGRPSNTLKMGIVGLPNVGKSSLFNLLSNLAVSAENFPFCTIEPNIASVLVPDSRYEKLCTMYEPNKRIPASLKITDIAGLVPGANEGLGLGNAFLSHINGVDGIYHVVRVFPNEEIVHTEGEVNPVNDLETIKNELRLKDIQFTDNRIEDTTKFLIRNKSKEKEDELTTLNRAKAILESGENIKDVAWSNNDIETLNHCSFLTSKPIVYLLNMGEEDYKKKANKWLPKIVEWVKSNGGGPIIPFSVSFEERYTAAENKEEFKTAEGVPSVVNKIIRTGYSSLALVHFFTVGKDEVRCWTIRKGTKAPKAAGIIHSDMEIGFICAEVTKYTDLIELGNEVAVKAEGKVAQKGKEYEVQDGDILFIKFNVGKKKKK